MIRKADKNVITTEKNEANQGHCTPVGCHLSLQAGMVCAESGKEAMRENEAVMSSPGATEGGRGDVGQEVYSAERETSKLGVLITFTS